ncbi:hypothetical protein ACLBYG_22365 [Methylobacterium sp. D53M]
MSDVDESTPRGLRGHPPATDFLIVGPEHLLGDEGERERLTEAMAAAFPGREFGLSEVAFGVEPELDLIPMCGYVGSGTNDQMRGMRSPLPLAEMDAMREALRRFSQGGRGLN